ncbi:MAG: hypothetical protein ACFFDT_21620, partial [Candidatus Hodarchaeota archaeon]
MPINYLCIDDENTAALKPSLDLIEQSADIKIHLIEPEKLEDSIDNIKKSNSDGLILDLRLDKKVGYRGPTVAQELRTRMVEGELRPFPIVLWSVDENLQSSFNRDDTAQDLFDLIYIKDGIESAQMARELISFVKGYNAINEHLEGGCTEIYTMLGLGDDESEMLDPRIGDIFRGLDKPKSAHEYARYIHKELILIQGPLIDEQVLAARLGIDIEKSPAWKELTGPLSDNCGYRGAFNDAWPRWWARKLESWWLEFSGKKTPLRRLQATERVEILNNNFGKGAFVQASLIEE